MLRCVGALLFATLLCGIVGVAARSTEPKRESSPPTDDSVSQQRSVHRVDASPAVLDEQERLAIGNGPQPLEVYPLPPDTVFHHVETSADRAPVTAGEEKLIYSNTLGTFGAVPGANRLVADDIATTGGPGCPLRRYAFPVVGKVDPNGIGGAYTVTFALYSSCPGSVPSASRPALVIPGTQGQGVFPDDAPRLITFVAGPNVPLQTNMWLGVSFSRGNAGVVVGAPAMKGFSADSFDYPWFPCSLDLGGFPDQPHASFNAEIYADADCPEAFVGYKDNRPSGSLYNPGANLTFADDIQLGVNGCQMVAYEVAAKGVAFYTFDMRLACEGPAIPGTEKFFTVGSGTDVKIARFIVDPPIPLPQNLWFSAKINNVNGGVVVAGVQAAVGQTEDVIGVIGDTGCSPINFPNTGIRAALNVSITCAGAPPVGACCDMIFFQCVGGPDDGRLCCPEDTDVGSFCHQDATAPDAYPPCAAPGTCEMLCRDGLPEMNCPTFVAGVPPQRAWTSGEACTAGLFVPACGVAACCVAKGACENLTRAECQLRGGAWNVRALCDPCGRPCTPPVGLCGASGTVPCTTSDVGACATDGSPCTSDAECTGGQTCRFPGGCADCVCCTQVCEANPACCDNPGWTPQCTELAAQICEAFNDRCLDAKRLYVGQPMSERTVDLRRTAESYGNSFCCDELWPYGEAEATVWYWFTATAESARLHTCDPQSKAGDSILQVYDVADAATPLIACDSLTAIACNDDAEAGSDCAPDRPGVSDVCVSGLTIGTTYYVMLAARHRSTDAGPYTINIEMPCPVPPHPNDSCETPYELTGLTASAMIGLTGSTVSCPSGPCASWIPDHDVWFKYTPPVCGYLSASFFVPGAACGSVTLSLYEGCDCPTDPLGELQCTSSQCYPDGDYFFYPSFLAPVEQDACYLVRVQGTGVDESNLGRLALCLEPGDWCDISGLPENYNRDCDGRGVFDACEIAMGAADCDGDGWLDRCEISYELAQDCNENQVPDDCELATGAYPDCNLDGEIDACDIADGSSVDCNANGVPDECDLVAGVLHDDDGDGIPTECEPDCQPNGVIDDVDIAVGTSTDCNADGRPDECGAAYNCDLVRLVPWGPPTWSGFGLGLAIDGDRVLVGAPLSSFDMGAAYLFRRASNGWARVTKFIPPPGIGGDVDFGISVALSGNVAVIGAPDAACEGNWHCGAAFVYAYNGFRWLLQQKLVPSDVQNSSGFGASVTTDGDRILVSSYAAADAVYVFERDVSGWREHARLPVSGVDAVVLSNDTVMIGIGGQGAVLYRRGEKQWVHEADLNVAYAARRAFALDGDVAVIGAPDAGGGNASVFRRSQGTWAREQTLPNPAPNDLWDFGAATAVDGDEIVVGAPSSGSVPGCYGGGRALVYTYDGHVWVQLGFVCNRDRFHPSSGFGMSIASNDGLIVVGANSSPDYPPCCGDAYVMEWRGPDCDGDAVPDACEIRLGKSDDCDGNGIPDTCHCGLQPISPAVATGIPTGCAADCQANGIADYLDIANGTSEDCNLDGIPDECGLRALTYTEIQRKEDVCYPQAIATGDFDEDGDQDFIATTSVGPHVYLNNGDGTFTLYYAEDCDFFSFHWERDVIAADLNGDGHLDFAQTFGGNVAVWLNRGFFSNGDWRGFDVFNVRFLIPPDPQHGPEAHSLEAIDIDHDGDLDIVACFSPLEFSGGLPGSMAVYKNNGFADFTLASAFAVGSVARLLSVADLNGDDEPDVVVANQISEDLSVLINLGSPAPGQWNGFAPEIRVNEGLPAESHPFGTAAGDVDGDGDPDVLVSLAGSDEVAVYLNNGSDGAGVWLGLTHAANLRVGVTPLFVLLADLNGDGRLDAATADTGGNTLTTLVNLGQDPLGGWRGFAPPVTIPGGWAPVYLHFADVHNDGEKELLVSARGFDPGLSYVGAPSVTLMAQDRLSIFAEPFADGHLDPDHWPSSHNAEVTPYSPSPGSSPGLLFLNGDASLESRGFDLSNVSGAMLRFYVSGSGCVLATLGIDYWTGQWSELAIVPPYGGCDHLWRLVSFELPLPALRDGVRFRFQSLADDGNYGNWLIDDVSLLVHLTDCDSDGRLDSCEIAEDRSLDRNANHRLDSCDLDLDGDGDVDLREVSALFRCFRGDAGFVDPACAAIDFFPNQHVDLPDVAAFVSALTGPR